MAASEHLSIRTPAGLKDKIKKAAGDKRGALNKWVIQALRNALKCKDGECEDKGTVQEQAAKHEKERRFDKMLDDQLLNAMNKNKNLLAGLSDSEIARLIAQRAPKPKGSDEDLKKSALSLTESLKLLPDVDDLTAELSKLRQQLAKMESEKEINQAAVNSLRAKLKKDNKAAWNNFKEACLIMQERCNSNDREAGIRGLDREDIKMLVIE